MSGRQTGLYGLLLLLVVASGWFLFTRDSGLSRDTVSETGPDAFVVDLDLKIMNEQGRLAYQLRARHMTHYPNEELFRLDQPDIRIVRSKGGKWRIRSERGETTDSTDVVWLLGTVDIRRKAGKSGNPLHIVTSELKVLPDEEIAETDQAASITSPGLEINSVGMKADLGNNTLELRSRVRGRYDVAG